MVVRNKCIGAIWLHYEKARNFPNSFIRDMQDYANYVSIAYDKAQRIKELSQLQQIIHSATRAIALNDINTTLRLIVAGVQDLLNCDITTIYYVNTYTGKLNYFPTIAGKLNKPTKVTAKRVLDDESFVYEMLKLNKIDLIYDTSKDKRFHPDHRRFVKDEEIKTCAVIPLIINARSQLKSKKVGVMFVNFRNSYNFKAKDIDILNLFAGQAAIAIDNAQMYERAKWRSDIWEMLYTAFTTRDNDDGIQTIIHEIPKQILIILAEKSQNKDCISYVAMIHGSKIVGFAPSQPDLRLRTIDLEKDSKLGIIGRVLKTKKSVRVDNVDLDDDYISVRLSTKSQLSVPISSNDQVVGIITVEHPEYRAFSEEDERNIEWLAIQVGLVIEKSEILDQVQKQTLELIQTRDTARKIAELVSRPVGLKEFIQKIGQLIMEMVKCDLVSIYIKNPNTGQMEVLRIGNLQDELKRQIISTPEIIDLFQMIDKPYIVEDLDNDPIFSDKDLPKSEGLRSFISYPLRISQEDYGFIFLNYRYKRHFGQHELENNRFVIDQVVAALRSILLIATEKRQNYELNAANETAVNILQEVDFKKRLDVIVAACCELLSAQGAKLYLLSSDKMFLELKSVVGSEIGEFIKGFSVEDGVAGYVIRNNLPFYISDDYASSPYKIDALTPYLHSVIEVPLLIDNVPIGVLGAFANNKERIFDEQDDLMIMKRLAKQAALAIRDSQLVEQSNKLREIARELGRVLDPEQAAYTILDGLRTLIVYNSATLQLIDIDKNERRLFAGYGIDWNNLSPKLTRPMSEDYLIKKVLSGTKIRVIPNTADHPYWDKNKATAHVLSWIGIPLWAGNKPIALITADHSQPGFYSDVDEELLELFAGQAAIAINNAHLFKAIEKRNQQLTETQNKLELTQNLGMIGLFYGEDIHYTSNKLGSAKAHAKYIQGHPEQHDKVVDKAHRIIKNVTDILDLVENIRKTIQPPKTQRINLYDILQEAINSVPMSRAIEHKWPCEPIAGIVYGLGRQLKQVFRVIIYNAQNAMPEGEGSISYCLKNERRDDTDYILVSITDTGVGIPKKAQPYVFTIGNPFDDVDKTKSFSFGLAWAKLFLRTFEGDVWV